MSKSEKGLKNIPLVLRFGFASVNTADRSAQSAVAIYSANLPCSHCLKTNKKVLHCGPNAVASLGLVSPGAATKGVTPIFSRKK